MSLFKMKRGQESKVNSLAKEDGSLIFSLNGANDSTLRLDQNVSGTVQRLGIAVDKAKNAEHTNTASTANVAKLISPFENATANVSRNVWFSDSTTKNKPVYNDNFKYNPVSQILTTNISGSAASATTAKYLFQANEGGTAGKNGWVKAISIQIKASYCNSPLMFAVTQRRKSGPTFLYVYFSNSNSVDPPLGAFSYSGNSINAKIIKSATSIWDIWIQKAESYDSIGVMIAQYDFPYIGPKVTISYPDTFSESDPGTGTSPSPFGNVSHSANSDALGGSSLSQVLASAGGGNAFTGLDTTTNNKIKLTRANGGTVEKTINNVSNASTASFASVSACPQGFALKTSSATWGNTTGTFLTGWHTSSGGDIAFMDSNPASGQLSVKVDGYFYQNEGANRVLDTADAANYVKKAGDTMTGLLTLKTGNQQGIKLGSAWMTAASDSNGEFVLQNGHLRFGSSAWDYNKWAGLKYDADKKYVYLGIADGTIFTANSAQSGGLLFTPGISGIYIGGTTTTRVATSSDLNNYLAKSGGTMTGALNFANNTWNKVGDDVKIGDHNIAGSLGVMGANGNTRIDWCKYGDASKYQGIIYDGTKLATSGTFKADYFDGVAKDSQALAGSTLAQIIEAAGGVITITKNLKPTVDWLDTGIAGTALSTGTYVVQVSGLSSGNTPGIYSEIWSGIFSWYSGDTNSTNSDEILLHNAGHADNSNELYLRTTRQERTSGGVMKLQMAVKQASTSTVDVTFKFRKMI